MTTATDIREKPIIFSGPMVRAILAGRKTQTRRVVKPQPDKYEKIRRIGEEWHRVLEWDQSSNPITCPYGQPETQLWVRETHAFHEYREYDPSGAYSMATGEVDIRYRASGDSLGNADHWRPSIHMPRWASRIQLEVTDVRVERLQEISEKDAFAEGVPRWANEDDIANGHYLDRPLDRMWCEHCGGTGLVQSFGANYGVTEVECSQCDTPRKLFRNLWDSINADRGYPWKDNPWVWLVGFKPIRP